MTIKAFLATICSGLLHVRFVPLVLAACAAIVIGAFAFHDLQPPALSKTFVHECTIRAVAFSSDGKLLAAAGGQTEPASELRIWNTADGSEKCSLTGHQNSIRAMAFSPRGCLLGTAGYDRTLRIWNTATGVEEHLCPLTAYPATLVFSNDGKVVAVSSDDRSIQLFDVETGAVKIKFDCQHPCLTCMAFSPDDTEFATWNLGQQAIDIWDAGTGRHRTEVRRPDDQPIAQQGFESWMLVYSSKGPILLSAISGSVEVWDAAAGEVRSFREPDNSLLKALALSANGKLLAVGNSHGMIYMWDVATGKRLPAFRGHEDAVTALAFSPDGRHLASGSREKTVILWDLRYGPQQTVVHVLPTTKDL
jgi:WD40 repeat protein